ncbi:MAG: hypothetical protein JO016_13300 [Actinobacteria bacterium]|nr:hypothetical protein [Actinomycetota bacterium]
MTISTTTAHTGNEDGDAVRSLPLDSETAPYCSACGNWAGMFEPGDGWQHWRGHPAPNGTRARFDAGHEVQLAWCVPPAQTISPAQHQQLLAALDDAIAYREHAASSGYATQYRMLRRQLMKAFPRAEDE